MCSAFIYHDDVHLCHMINWRGGYDSLTLDGALFYVQSGISFLISLSSMPYRQILPTITFTIYYSHQISVLTIMFSVQLGLQMDNVTPGAQQNIVSGPVGIVVSTIYCLMSIVASNGYSGRCSLWSCEYCGKYILWSCGYCGEYCGRCSLSFCEYCSK